MLRRHAALLIVVLSTPFALAAPANAGVTPPPPNAITAGIVDGVLAIGSTPGLAARTTISRSGGNFIVTDPGGITFVNGCSAVSTSNGTSVRCVAPGVTSVQFLGRGGGFDRVLAQSGLGVRAIVNGGAGNDRLVSAGSGDDLFGDLGADVLIGNGGLDRLYGGGGNDVTRGGAGNDRHDGGPGNDMLNDGSTGGNDLFFGRDGDDSIAAAGDPTFLDHIYGGTGMDRAVRDPADTFSSIEDLITIN